MTKNKKEDQAGFRSSYQTTDHFATYRMIEQKCHEWGINLWNATIDFTKAFDSITHKSIWKALKSCGINHEYISLLKKFYKDQNASVQTDVESNMFEIKKGTKQGDPLSSLLINTVLQKSLKDVTKRWQKKNRNGNLPERLRPRLPHKPEVRRRRAFFRCLQRSASKKCCTTMRKVQKKWDSGYTQKRRKFSATEAALAQTRKKKCKSMTLKIEILTRKESLKYSGQLITFQQQETTEIKNRIRAAWATFHKYKQELTSKNYMLKHRLRLFDAAITPTICCASGTWAPTREHERIDTIGATQNAPSHHTKKEDTNRS